jgi:CDP-glucose 4,6-dehydratase
LNGYLLLARKMWEAPTEYCEGWNFGPETDSVSTVWEVAEQLVECFGQGSLKDVSAPGALHEANTLKLDITKAQSRLGWKPRLTIPQAIALTADWYRRYKDGNIYELCVEQIKAFEPIR